jgi:hypothetical protein
MNESEAPKKARVIVTYDCDRDCRGCCNKNWKYDPPKPIKSFKGFSEVIITGGEPLLFPRKLGTLITQIRKENSEAKIFVYTSATELPWLIKGLSQFVDGLCLTLHDKLDVSYFNEFQIYNTFSFFRGKSMRLNIFRRIDYPFNTSGWKVKANIRWKKDCPLPKDETLYRLPKLWAR